MASAIKFNPSAMSAKYQLAMPFDRKAWVLSMNESLVYNDDEYHLELHITVQGGRDAEYIMTPQIRTYGLAFGIVTMKEFIDWEREMEANVEKLTDQLQAKIDYMQTHYVMDHEACSIDTMTLLQWYQQACEMANHFMAIVNLGLIKLHVTM